MLAIWRAFGGFFYGGIYPLGKWIQPAGEVISRVWEWVKPSEEVVSRLWEWVKPAGEVISKLWK